MKALLAFLFFSICFLLFGQWPTAVESHPAYTTLCQIVADHYFKKDSNLIQWKKDCLKRAQHYAFRQQTDLVERLRGELSILGGSHLDIYEPIEQKRIWSGTSGNDTGLRTRFIEGELIVYDIISQSSADEVGVKVGESISSINGESPNVGSAQGEGGLYKIKDSGGQARDLQIELRTLSIDESPKIYDVGEGIARLKVSSFRGELFDTKSIKALIRELGPYRGVIVDLRGNLGGNIVAGLRLLGALTCDQQAVGSLTSKEHEKLEGHPILANELSDAQQIEQITRDPIVSLQSFKLESDCTSRPIVVLVDHNSSSTAEIVAEALRQKWLVPVLGTPSAGRVLIAVWYNFPELGQDYSISIPERRFLTLTGKEIEGIGVYPDQTLYYRLNEAQRGQDSWIIKAKQHLLEGTSQVVLKNLGIGTTKVREIQ